MTTTESYETQTDTDAVNRFVNALNKHTKAVDLFSRQALNDMLYHRAELAKLEAQHARREMVRRAKMHSWNEGHNAVCDVPALVCEVHKNPYTLVGRGTGAE